MSRRHLALVVLAVLLLAWLPYGSLLGHLPWGPDAAKWLDRGSLDHPTWFDWVFRQQHFIGYRPVAALSFLLNWLVTGYAPWGYRATDLALHAASAFALFDLYRQLTGDRGAWGLVPVVLLCGHPATEEVVPFVARRSYLLASVFGLSGLGLAMRAARAQGSALVAWGVASGTSLTLAVLSNEGAYVLLPLLPRLLLHALDGGPLRDALRRAPAVLVPAALGAVFALWRRFEVLGSLSGGYHKRFFAFVRNDVPHWRELDEGAPWLITKALWDYALTPHSVVGGHALLHGELGDLAWPALAGTLMALCVVSPLVRVADPAQRVLGLCALWMAEVTLLVVASETWFWRQATFLLPPLGIAVGVLLQQAVAEGRAGRWGAALKAVPAALILAGAVWSGPLPVGLHLRAHNARLTYGPLARQVATVTADLPADSTVYLVVPAPTGASHMVRLWADRFGQPSNQTFRVLAELAPGADPAQATARIARVGGKPRLELDGEHLTWAKGHESGVKLRAHHKLRLDKLYDPDEPRAVLVLGEHVKLRRVPPPGGG